MISNRNMAINYSGDIVSVQNVTAATNPNSPILPITIINFVGGGNTITVPAGALTCTIIPPVGNTVGIYLKGISADTGVALSKTDPTTIALDPSVVSFVIRALSAITSVRFLWS